MPDSVRVLLVDDDTDDFRITVALLNRLAETPFELDWAQSYDDGLAALRRGDYDVCLVDYLLGARDGLAFIAAAQTPACTTPLILYTGSGAPGLDLAALRAGASDYLVKGEVNARVLDRTLRYAVERHRVNRAMLELAYIDELTGLRNRRGFRILGEQHLEVARHLSHGVLIAFADVDRLKEINDTWGHAAGDRALAAVAAILRDSFRSSDLVARWSGDEFAALVIGDFESGSGAIERRIGHHLAQYNDRPDTQVALSLSIGVARFPAADTPPLAEMVARTDQRMYTAKRCTHAAIGRR